MKSNKINQDPDTEVIDQGPAEQCKRTAVRLTHQRNSLFLTEWEKWISQSVTAQENHHHRIAPQRIWINQSQPAFQPTYLFSAAATFMASIMSFTVSIICLALIVCCSNLVFTADCEIHSCEGPKPQHITAIPCQHIQEFHCQKAHAANFTTNLNQQEIKRKKVHRN